MATLTPQAPPAGGLLPGARGAGANIPGGLIGEGLFSEALPRYHALAKSGFVYVASAAAINPSAFVGGAAGTPIFGLYNPANSGKDLIILQARLAVRTLGTAAVSAATNFWAVNQGGVAVAGTNVPARNMYSQAASGSVANCNVNTASTGALASNLIAPSVSLSTVATAVEFAAQLLDPVDGAIIVAPGTYLAYGLAAALTGGSMDAALIWAELPA